MGEATEGGGNVDYQHLSTLLWREQELLDLLLFKAEEKQYLILTGKTRWLPRIAHEIEVVLDQLRTLEVERAAAIISVAAARSTSSVRSWSRTTSISCAMRGSQRVLPVRIRYCFSSALNSRRSSSSCSRQSNVDRCW